MQKYSLKVQAGYVLILKKKLTKRPDTAEFRPCSDGLPSKSAIRQICVTCILQAIDGSHPNRPKRCTSDSVAKIELARACLG